nr:MAG TPA: hypothetical protein [Caudoviricetes sp.]
MYNIICINSVCDERMLVYSIYVPIGWVEW